MRWRRPSRSGWKSRSPACRRPSSARRAGCRDAPGRYIEFCKSTFPNELDLAGWRIVVDCAHGAGYHVAPPVFHELGAEVIAVGNEPDGININAGVGATHPDNLRRAVVEHKADLGIALDGDGDRLLMVDRDGRAYDGDQLLYVIAMDYRRRGALVGGVIGTLMTNLGFEKALAAQGIVLERARVGDRYVLERLSEKGWLLGGENSGHLLCLDKHTTGDAIVAALAVLRALIEQRTTLAEAAGPVQLYPQRLINVPVVRGWDWVQERCRARRRALGLRRPRRLGARAAAPVGHRTGAAGDGRGSRPRARRHPGAGARQGDRRSRGCLRG